MKPRSRFKIVLIDESRLETVADYSASPLKWTFLGGLFLLASIVFGALVVSITPARNLLPGYLKDSERSANQMNLLRLDSIRMAYETNATYIENLLNVINPHISRTDTSSLSALTTPLSPDSLIPTSPEELNFVTMMREREKYNISVIAPLAAESLMFSPVSDDAVFTEKSRLSTRAEIVMAKNSSIAAIADGKVIAVSQSIRDGGSSIIIQHPKGFLSRCSRLGTVLVEPGDMVTGGQIIALSNKGNGKKGEIICIEMWHNGDSLVPSEYIEDRQSLTPRQPIIDVEVGRGR
ncbi:MAG: M23 family metallopeptidase [Muribaculaceae bacterium]|nr:M23 family metallopeptidase [Muribaculaceae bacterium]